MIIVVDTNIVFSAILSSSGRIGQLLTIGQDVFYFYSINFLEEELHTHFDKLQSISNLPLEDLNAVIQVFISRINFIDVNEMSDSDILNALRLTKDIDEKDTLFVALTNHLNGRLWTGDQKLMKGLLNKGYENVISTDSLYQKFLNAR